MGNIQSALIYKLQQTMISSNIKNDNPVNDLMVYL